MGATPSKGSGSSAYRSATEAYQGTAGVSGGGAAGSVGGFFYGGSVGMCPPTTGGHDDKDKDTADLMKELKTYEVSLAAKVKDDLVRKIATAVSGLGIAGIDPNADLAAIVKALREKIPNPGRQGKTFKAEAKSQEKVCRTVAAQLNKQWPGLIDPGLGPEAVCAKLSMWVESLATGVYEEFMAVHGRVREVMRNIEVLEALMRESYTKTMDRVKKENIPEVERDISNWHQLYERAEEERKFQLSILKNLVKVDLAPVAKELELAMRDESEANKLIRRVGLTPGSIDLSDSISYAVSGLGTAAAVAQKVHLALKKLGISVSDYLSSENYKKFDELVEKMKREKAAAGGDLAALIKHADELRKTFARREELRDALKEESISPGMAVGGARGGDGDSDKKSTIDRRVEKVQAEKKLIIRDFAAKVNTGYGEIIASIKDVAPKLGKQIPLSDKTNALAEALLRLRSLFDYGSIELALVGRYLDASSRERKERFLTAIRMASGAIDDMGPVASNFARLKAALDGLARTVDFYADAFVKKFGGAEDGDEFAAELYTGGAGESNDYSGVLGEAVKFRGAVELREALSEFTYYHFSAKVRQNFALTGAELDEYGAKYDEVLGDAVAQRLKSLLTVRDEALKNLKTASEAETKAADTDAKKKAAASAYALRKEMIESEFATKEKFYRALQALDLYLKAFTRAIVDDPDAARDIKKMLDGTQVIARWFSEATGESIAVAFDYMPHLAQADARTRENVTADADGKITAGTVALEEKAGDHYYEKVAAAEGKNVDVGVPQATVNLVPDAANTANTDSAVAAIKNARAEVGKALDNFQGLKNLINAFVRIGDRFGGADLRNKMLLTPAQIYNILVAYLRESAISIGVKAGAAPTAIINNLSVSLATATPASAPYEAYFGSVPDDELLTAPLVGRYDVEDNFFGFMIKAMAAKVLVVVGVYDLLERPGPVAELMPLRMIVGGADEYSTPEVVEGAAELYFRLPRLIEFYRAIFSWDGESAAVKMAMLPEVEGVFSGIVRLIFLRATGAESGDYSDIELRMMVREVNAIYGHFRDKGVDAITSNAVNAFVREVNRRYGVIKSDEIKKYLTMVQYERTLKGSYSETDANRTNYAILPGEGEDIESSTTRLPSDRYMIDPSGKKFELGGKFELDTDLKSDGGRGLLRGLRRKIEGELDVDKQRVMLSMTYGTLIKQAEAEIKRAAGADARFAVVAKLIQGVGVISIDSGKALMFHESVVVTLNVLTGIYSLLSEFKRRIAALDMKASEALLEEKIHTDQKAGALAALTRAMLATALGPDRTAYLLHDGTFTPPGAPRATPAYVYGANGRAWAQAASTTTAADLLAWIQANAGTPSNVKAFSTFALDYHAAMRDLLVSVFELTSSAQGLVELRTSTGDNQIHLDFSKLRSVVEELLADAKRYLDTVRPYIPKTVIDQFEGDAKKPGSVFWLERNLIDGLIRGVSGETKSARAETLEGLSHKVGEIFAHLTRALPSTASQFGAAGGGVVFTDVSDDKKRAAEATALNLLGAAGGAAGGTVTQNEAASENYGQVFAGLIFYNALAADSGIAGGRVALATGPLNTLVREKRYEAKGGELVDGKGAPKAGRLDLYSDVALNGNRSMMMMLNQLVGHYLARFYDAPSGRIFSDLISPIANGVYAQAVMGAQSGGAHPDLTLLLPAPPAVSFERRHDPQSRAVLLQSLALVMQRIIKDAHPTTNQNEHLLTTLTDVPPYMKESMRCNLPYFARLFDLLVKEGEMLKQVAQKTKINLARPIIAGRVPTNAYGTGSAFQDPLAVVSGGAPARGRLIGILESISAGAYALSTAANDVLRQLADTPVAFEPQEKFSQVYRERYGKAPLMPLSLAASALQAVDDAKNVSKQLGLLPIFTAGDINFRAAYGVRGLFGRSTAVGYEQLPGVRHTLELFNGIASKREQAAPEKYLEFVRRLVSALRFTVDVRHFAATTVARTVADNFARTDIFAGVGDGMKSFAVKKDLQGILDVIESSNQDDQLQKLTEGFEAASAPSGGRTVRQQERINNLVDLNVIPINVHAMMRDIPLANIYNYEYTFDEMTAKMYGMSAESLLEKAPRDTREMFLKMLMEPFMQVTKGQYGSDLHDLGTSGFVHRIFRGDNALGMGRPKFLSDQLFNKALFGSTFQLPQFFDEAGPPVGAGVSRGRTNEARHVYERIDEIDDILIDVEGKLSPHIGNLVNLVGQVTTARLGQLGKAANLLNSAREIIGRIDGAESNPKVRLLSAILEYAATLSSNPTVGVRKAKSMDAGAPANLNLAAPWTAVTRGLIYIARRFATAAAVWAWIQKQQNRPTAAVAAGTPLNAGAALAVVNLVDAKDSSIEALNDAAVGGAGPIIGNVGAALAAWGRAALEAMNQVAMALRDLKPIFSTLASPDGFDDIGGIVAHIAGSDAGVDQTRSAQYLAMGRGESSFAQARQPHGRTPPSAWANLSDSDPRAAKLSYLREQQTAANRTADEPESAVKVVDIGPGVGPTQTSANRRNRLEDIGFLRFNTRFVRKIFFITNVVRIMRLKLSRELVQSRSVLVSSHSAVSADVTEYGTGAAIAQSTGPWNTGGPNEIYGHRKYGLDVEVAGHT